MENRGFISTLFSVVFLLFIILPQTMAYADGRNYFDGRCKHLMISKVPQPLPASLLCCPHPSPPTPPAVTVGHTINYLRLIISLSDSQVKLKHLGVVGEAPGLITQRRERVLSSEGRRRRSKLSGRQMARMAVTSAAGGSTMAPGLQSGRRICLPARHAGIERLFVDKSLE